MANKLEFVATMDASGFASGMQVIEARAKESSGRMSKILYADQRGQLGQSKSQIEARATYEAEVSRKAKVRGHRQELADAMAAGRERAAMESRMERIRNFQQMLAAEKARTGAFAVAAAANRDGKLGRATNLSMGASMFVSVARDSAASLASGAPAIQVIAQQAPQVLQALFLMRLGALGLKGVLLALAVGGVYFGIRGIIGAINQVGETARIAAMSVDRLKSALGFRASEMGRDLMRQGGNLEIRRGAAQTADLVDQQRASEHDADVADLISQNKGKVPDDKLEKMVAELRVKQAQDTLKQTMSRNDIGKDGVQQAELNLKQAELKRQKLLDEAAINVETARQAKDANPDSVAKLNDYVIAKALGGMTPELSAKMDEVNEEIRVATAEIPEAKKQAQIKTNIARNNAKTALVTAQTELRVLNSKKPPVDLYTDQLLGVGNFLGARGSVNSLQEESLRVQRQQLVVQEKIATAVVKISEKKGSEGTIEVP